MLRVLASLDTVVNGMIDFSTELERTFDVLDVESVPNDKLTKLVSEGEAIREHISQHLDSLDKLRGTLTESI